MTDTTETGILLTKPREKPEAIKIEIKVMSKEAQIWEYLVETGLATEEELKLVTNICGYSVETLENVIYSRTALNSFEQLQEADGNS